MVSKHWMSGREVVERWHIHEQEIVEKVQEGLQPHDRLYSPIPPPGVAELARKIQELRLDYQDIEERYPEIKNKQAGTNEWFEFYDNYGKTDSTGNKWKKTYADGSDSDVLEQYYHLTINCEILEKKLNEYPLDRPWKGYEIPLTDFDCKNSENERASVIQQLLDAFFKIEDIVEYENKTENSLVIATQPALSAEASDDIIENDQPEESRALDSPRMERSFEKATTDANETADDPGKNFFRRRGAMWCIRFQGQETILPDHQYARCIAYILKIRPEKISCSMIVNALNKDEKTNYTEEMALNEGLNIGVGGFLETKSISQRDIDRLNELLTEIDEAESGSVESEKLICEKDEFLKQLYALKKRDRYMDRKCQDSIRKKLDMAFAALEKGGAKTLAKHLKKEIRRGGNYDLFYADEKIFWDVLW